MTKYIKLAVFIISLLILLVSCDNDDIVMHSHSYGSWQIDTQPTCTEDGILKRACACGYTENTEIKALSHTYSNKKVISEATCKERGLAEYTCNLCGDVKYDILDKMSHTPSEIFIVTDTYHARECGICRAAVGKEEHFYMNNECVICHIPRFIPTEAFT